MARSAVHRLPEDPQASDIVSQSAQGALSLHQTRKPIYICIYQSAVHSYMLEYLLTYSDLSDLHLVHITCVYMYICPCQPAVRHVWYIPDNLLAAQSPGLLTREAYCHPVLGL